MNFTEQFVAITMATLRADGIVSEKEMGAITFLANGLELDMAEVERLVKTEATKTTDVMSIARQVADADKDILMEACIIVALSDNHLAVKEAMLLKDIADAMGVDIAKVMLTIAAVTQNNREIRIEGNESAYEQGDEIEVD